ncbi:MAG: hypothetical protein IT182_18415 [Acidobacteria bacterium]|nr:hypothetical protein [Acidobacteriota bacterium]
MRLHIEVDGRQCLVSVSAGREPGTLDVRVDGTLVTCDVRRHGSDRVSLRLPDGSMHDLLVETDVSSRGQRVVHVDGRRVPVGVFNGVRRRAASAVAGNGPLRVTAPMPGKVVRVPVAAGDRVEARQPVVGIEAMKMENALSAGRAGVVRDVLVQEGQSVEAGRPLVVVE